MPIPEYTKRAYRMWYARNKDKEDFKERRNIANRKAYEKRKLRIIEEAKKLVIIKEDQDVSSNIVLVDNYIQSNIGVVDNSNISLVDNSNIVVNNSNIGMKKDDYDIETDDDEEKPIIYSAEKRERLFNKEVENLLNPLYLFENEYDIINKEFYKNSIITQRQRFSIYNDNKNPNKSKTMKKYNTYNNNLRQTKKKNLRHIF